MDLKFKLIGLLLVAMTSMIALAAAKINID